MSPFHRTIRRSHPDSVDAVLRRAPLFVVTVAATMGLGLGLLGSAFTILNAYLLKPIDLPSPRALYSVSWDTDGKQRQRFGLSDVEALQRDAQHLSRVAATLDATVMEEAVATRGLLVTGDYFDLLGACPTLGRLLRPDDAAARGGRAVVVLSHDLWRSRYGANPAIVGQQVHLGRQRSEVVGVVGPEARLSTLQEGVGFWAPLTMAGAFPVVDPWSHPTPAHSSSSAGCGRTPPRSPRVSGSTCGSANDSRRRPTRCLRWRGSIRWPHGCLSRGRWCASSRSSCRRSAWCSWWPAPTSPT